jgi:hypothetical protein
MDDTFGLARSSRAVQDVKRLLEGELLENKWPFVILLQESGKS